MLKRKIEKLERKLSAKKRIYAVIWSGVGEDVDAKTFDEAKSVAANRFGFNSFEELQRAYEVTMVIFKITEVDVGSDGEIIEIEDEPEGYIVHCYSEK